MGPRKTFSESDIIDAAVEIVREQGLNAISTRSIARKLKSSTMPIYSTLKSMGSLEDAVRRRVLEMLQEYQSRSYSPNPAFDQAIGYVQFARDEALLFQFLFSGVAVSRHTQQNELDSIAREKITRDSPMYEHFMAIASEQQSGFVLKNWIYIHGLATLIATGALQDIDDERLMQLISEAAEALYLWEMRDDNG